MLKFKNPYLLKHQGAFTVEIAHEDDVNCVPDTAKISDNIITVSHGRIEEVTGGIQFYALEKPFAWPCVAIRCIRDGNGELLWVNRHCTDEIE